MPFYERKEYKNSPEERAKMLAYQLDWRRRNPSWKERHNENRRDWTKRNREKRILKTARESAAKWNLEFNLEVSDIIIPSICPVLGIPLFFTDGKKTNNTPSLDRVDNDKGYIKGNVRVISTKANTMKGDLTLNNIDKFIAYMRWEI